MQFPTHEPTTIVGQWLAQDETSLAIGTLRFVKYDHSTVRTVQMLPALAEERGLKEADIDRAIRALTKVLKKAKADRKKS